MLVTPAAHLTILLVPSAPLHNAVDQLATVRDFLHITVGYTAASASSRIVANLLSEHPDVPRSRNVAQLQCSYSNNKRINLSFSMNKEHTHAWAIHTKVHTIINKKMYPFKVHHATLFTRKTVPTGRRRGNLISLTRGKK